MRGHGKFLHSSRTFAMKLLYSKPSWSCAALADFMAPTAKFQIIAVLFAMPYQSIAVSWGATAPGQPPTIASLAKHMLQLDPTDFQQGGGLCVVMRPGDFLWIREACLVAEFNIGLPKSLDILKALTWVALTEHHCSPESCKSAKAYVRCVMEKCCEPSQKHLEKHLQARGPIHQQNDPLIAHYC